MDGEKGNFINLQSSQNFLSAHKEAVGQRGNIRMSYDPGVFVNEEPENSQTTVKLTRQYHVAEAQYRYDPPALQNHHIGLTVNYEYVNYGEQTIYAIDQANTVFAISALHVDPQAAENYNTLGVYVTYIVNSQEGLNETKTAIYNSMHAGRITSAHAHEIIKKLDYAITNRRTRQAFQVSYFISISEITNKKGLFLPEAGVFFTTNTDYLMANPNSPQQAFREELLERDEDPSQRPSFIRLAVVDNLGIAEKRFYYSAKQLISVPSIRDTSKRNGVYVCVQSLNEFGELIRRNMYFSFDEAEEKFGLYTDQERAATHGNPELLYKVQEVKEKRELREVDRSIREIDHHATRYNKNAELELNEYKRQFELMRHEAQRAEERHASTENQRKREHEQKMRQLDELLILQKQENEKAARKSEKKSNKLKHKFEANSIKMKQKHDKKIQQMKEKETQATVAKSIIVAGAGVLTLVGGFLLNRPK